MQAEVHKCSVVERLEKVGILTPNTVLGHCVHVNDAELDIIKKTGVTVAHNVQSNLNNAYVLQCHAVLCHATSSKDVMRREETWCGVT